MRWYSFEEQTFLMLKCTALLPSCQAFPSWKLFTLTLMGLLGKQGQALQERISHLRRPRAEATKKGHAHLGAGQAA